MNQQKAIKHYAEEYEYYVKLAFTQAPCGNALRGGFFYYWDGWCISKRINETEFANDIKAFLKENGHGGY